LVAHAKKRMLSKDVLADYVAKMASSFQEFIRSSTQKLDVEEAYEESSGCKEEKHGVNVYFTRSIELV
jgi:hypothetical protein